MVQLELHRAIENRGQALAAKAGAEEQLRLATAAAGIGVWNLDVGTNELRWDARTRALFGVPGRGVVSYESSFLANVHPDDRARTDAAVRAALDPVGSHEFDVEYRVVAADTGQERWIAAHGRGLLDDGRTVRFLGTVRDVTETRAARAALVETEERYRLAARATTDAIWDWDLATNHVLWNEALGNAYGHVPGTVAPTGDWWLAHIHHEDRDRIEASVHAVIDGTGTAWADEYRFLRADGSYAPVLDRGYVIRDVDGRALRMIGAMLDLSEMRAAEAALRDSERLLGLERALLQAIFQQAPVGISIADTSSNWTTMVNARAEEMLGHGVGVPGDERYAGYGALHGDGRPYGPSEYPTMRALRHGETVRDEPMRYRNARTGEVRRFEVSSAPVVDAEGAPLAAVTVIVDVEDRLRAEAQAARLATIVEQSGDFIGIADVEGRGEYINPAGRRMAGLSPDAPASSVLMRDCFLPADFGFVECEVLPPVAAGGVWAGDFAFRHFETGEPVPVHYNQFSLRDPDGKLAGFATVSRDIADRKRAEALQDLLNRELSHRMKNLMAMVQAVASSTLRGATDAEAARHVLDGRLLALSKAHDVLLGGAVERAPLETVVRQGLGVQEAEGRVAYEGPDVEIGAKAALSLALTFHELATNAVKYGALSVPGGRVTVLAALLQSAEGPNLRVAWAESDGPPVTPPTRKGFGSRPIERGLSTQVGGRLHIDYAPEGCATSSRRRSPLSSRPNDGTGRMRRRWISVRIRG